MHPKSLAGLERRTFRATMEDGLLDMLLGFYLLAVAAGVLVNRGWLAGIIAAVCFPIWAWLRRTVTEPRLGYVKFGPAREAALRRGPFAVAAMMAGVILVGIWLGGRFAYTNVVFPALVFAVPLAAAAWLLDIRRFYFYALVVAAERAVDYLSGGPHDWVFWPSGLLITGAGVCLLITFLRRYPGPAQGAGADA